MALPLRHPVSFVVVALALVATGTVFAFARPQYRDPNASKTIDFSKQHYYSPASVRRAFAAHGIRLYAGAAPGGPGSAWMSNRPAPFPSDALNVMLGSRSGKGSWGAKQEPYDVRFGNVFISYGGHDEALLARVRAAVAELR